MNIFLIFNFSANLAIIFDFADESIVFHEYAGAYSRPACRARTSDQMTDIAAGGQSATRKMTQPISAQSRLHPQRHLRLTGLAAKTEVRGPSRIGHLTGYMRRSCHARSQSTFTRVKVKSRVDQAGMPSIFDDP